MPRTRYETAEAFSVAQELDVDFSTTAFTLEDFREGLDAELELCHEHPELSDDDPIELGRAVLAHLRADPGYYERLLEAHREPRTVSAPNAK